MMYYISHSTLGFILKESFQSGHEGGRGLECRHPPLFTFSSNRKVIEFNKGLRKKGFVLLMLPLPSNFQRSEVSGKTGIEAQQRV